MVGIYVRVSTEEQALHGFSIRAQIEKLSSFCKIKDWDIFDIYIDDGISGKNIKDRKAIIKLLSDIKIGYVNNVLVYKIDRLTRSTKDLIELIDFFNRYNCSFNSFTENIDTLSATGRMFIKIIGIFAEFERENISERVKFGLERKVKEGYTIASKIVSYGYRKYNGDKIQKINLYESYVVKRIFVLYSYNYSFTEIANYLNRLKVKRREGKWTYKNVKLLLSNPNYIGLVRYGVNKENYFEKSGRHERIVSDELYYSVKDMMNRNKLFICSCGKSFSTKIVYYYSKIKNKRVRYKKLYCSMCKKYYDLKKIYSFIIGKDHVNKRIIVNDYTDIVIDHCKVK